MEPVGLIIFGPKETAGISPSAQVFYTPTDEQKKFIREYFGWEFVTLDEAFEIMNSRICSL